GKLANDSENILKDNYLSIGYAKNMHYALDKMKDDVAYSLLGSKNMNENFETMKKDFEKNLKDEQNNITEIHEKEHVETLKKNYAIFLDDCKLLMSKQNNNSLYLNNVLPVYNKVILSINDINSENMQAVVNKNQIAKTDAGSIITYMSVISVFCIILAFFYFWYFPFYVSNSISYLSNKIKELLNKAGIDAKFKTDDESYVILQSINLIETKLNLVEK
ncbi:MAG: hypothetical protein ABSG15_11180, partial [FCB group bacterium]